MNKKLTSLIVYSVLSASLVGCGSLKIRDVNQDEVAKVRRVALASFSFQQPQAAAVGGNDPNLIAHPSDEVTAAMNDVAASLQRHLRWKVLPVDTMRGNATYKKFYEAKMKGWQSGKAPPTGKLFVAPEVMDAQSIRRMSPSERDELITALGVDAIMETQVTVAFKAGVAVMGFGPRHPQANISLAMYKKGIDKPVWFEGRMVGDASEKSVGATGWFDENEVTRLGRLSAKNAFDKVDFKKQ